MVSVSHWCNSYRASTSLQKLPLASLRTSEYGNKQHTGAYQPKTTFMINSTTFWLEQGLQSSIHIDLNCCTLHLQFRCSGFILMRSLLFSLWDIFFYSNTPCGATLHIKHMHAPGQTITVLTVHSCYTALQIYNVPDLSCIIHPQLKGQQSFNSICIALLNSDIIIKQL